DNFVTHIDNFGNYKEVFDGVDVSLQARFGRGGLIQGGMSTGRTGTDQCDIVQGNLTIPFNVPTYNLPPSGPRSGTNDTFCRVAHALYPQTHFKTAVNYPLPYDLQVSGTLQNLPGLPIQAVLPITGAQTTLGRALTTGQASVMIKVPYTDFEDRLNQV